MYSFDLKTKLKRLNQDLFIDDSMKRHIHQDFYATALNLNKSKRHEALLPSEYNRLNEETRKYLQDYDNGLLPEHICSVPVGWIPEHDQFVFDEKGNSRFVARGWRSVLMILSKKGIINLDKARRVFGCPGLGLDTYDRMTREQKESWAANKESA